VRWKLGSPVLFRQTRIGWKEQPFLLYKFRSMRDIQDPEGILLPDAARLTPFGAWMRSWSLDELPQLWNVLLGEMSFIGPRPLLPEYLPRYSEEHRVRHHVRPGLSGFAQVNGRNASTWRTRLDLDVQYVQKISPRMDLSIAWRTLGKLIGREGVSRAGAATMPEFQGLYHDT
ncbi:MAG: sugar transferase, partial [Bryobacterales bacterium]|nr:sugar transferase [Bryobacterales bacterium]